MQSHKIIFNSIKIELSDSLLSKLVFNLHYIYNMLPQ